MKKLLYSIIVFGIPFVLYFLTAADALMFDDAAEFGLVIRLNSIAHPPGTPAYIFFGNLWDSIGQVLNFQPVLHLSMFSALCMSGAVVLLFHSFLSILHHHSKTAELSTQDYTLAGLAAIGFALSATTWAWANTIEVYAFQTIAFSLALYGLISHYFKRNQIYLLIAAAGLALGLSNHHITMIFFLPFIPFFFLENFILSTDPVKSKKKSSQDTGIVVQLVSVLRLKKFWLLTGTVTILTLIFYGWMFYRAQSDYAFMFGKPDTLDRLIYHMRGGAYTKNITQTSGSIMAARLPYFLKLTAVQLGIFLPFLIVGCIQLYRSKRKSLLFVCITYFLFLFIYQLNNNQWASTDAYLLLPFMLLMIPVLFGLKQWLPKFKLNYILPLLLLIQIAWIYPSRDRKTYPVDATLMELLDKSAPKNSIVLVSDWTTVMQYQYHRYINNFRKDLIVLNYDIKFTHYRMLMNEYPEFYREIQPEYDRFLKELEKEHPEQLTTTGCDLSTQVLLDAFRALILKMEKVAKNTNRAFLTDPRAHVFYWKEKIYNPSRYVSGCFMSTVPGDSLSAATFLALDYPFLKSSFLLEDPGALDKLVDFQAMLDQHIEFYKLNNDTIRLQQAEAAHSKIMKLQREMKKSMSFAYKIY